MSDDHSWGGGKDGDLYRDDNVPLLDIRQAKEQLYKNGEEMNGLIPVVKYKQGL